MSNNDLQNPGVKLLSVAMRSTHCTLKTLRLDDILMLLYNCTLAICGVPSYTDQAAFTVTCIPKVCRNEIYNNNIFILPG